MKIDTRFQLAAFLICILATSIIGANSAFAFYDPPGNVPPGPPPNYNQIDTTYFAGAPVLPGVMEDSGGFYIWYDNTGAWNVANRIYKLTHGAENYHGSVLASMSAPPTPGVNVFATSFEIFDDSSSSYCYKQNDRWGWYQWDEGLYEIWWDVSTRSTAGQGDSTDYMKISILGCAIDFNVWSDDWDGRHFGPEYVFLGSSMTRLSDVPGFVDTYPGISDPYEADGHSGERNVSIYTRHSGNGNSYNKYGLITPDETHHCDNVLNDTYGSLFSGAFTYEGNGIEFSAGCVFNNCLNNTAPILQPPFNYNTFKCSPIQFCFDVDYVDDGNFRYFQKLSGPGTIDTLTGEVCFIPGPASQTYTFTILGADSCGLADTADYTVQVTLNSRPQATSPADQNLFVCDLSEIHLPGFSASDPDDNLVSINLVGGTLHGDTAYFTPVMGANTLTLIATDACGAADTSTTVVTINLNRPPEATSPANSNQFVCDLGQICLAGFDATDLDDNLVSKTLMGGTLHGDTACFIPVEGQNTLRLIATDACGAADTSMTVVTVTMNRPPVAVSPADQNQFVCDLSEIHLPGFSASDPDDNLISTTLIGGTLHGDTAYFTPVMGANTLTLIATDACGVADTSTTVVTINLNRPPEATSPANSNQFVCDLGQICLAGFDATDPDDNLVSKTLIGGSLHGDTACFIPVEGQNTLRLIAVDACGAADTSMTVVTVTMNRPPVAISPADQNQFVCDLSEIPLPGFSASDPDDNLVSINLVGGTLHGDTAYFTPVMGANTLTLIATDACGAADTSITIVTIDQNRPPEATSPSNSERFVCDLGQICLAGFDATDPDDNLVSKTLIGGTLHGDTACFIPMEGGNTLRLIAVDACGAADTAITIVTVTMNRPPVAVSPADQNQFVCDLSEIHLPGFSASDPDDNLISTTLIGGTLHGDTAYFTPVMGANTLTLIATDACGAADTTITIVTVTMNRPPVAISPADQNQFVCDLSEIHLPGFSASDFDDNLISTTLIGGTLHGDTAYFTPVMGANTLTLIATDACGAADTSTTVVTINLNRPPEATSPANSEQFVCDLGQICLPGFDATDPDDNLVSKTLMGGTLHGDTACFIPVEGQNTLRLIAVDACGAADTAITIITITLNNPPIANSPDDTSLVDPTLAPICIPGFTAIDPDDNLVSTIVDGGTLSGDTVCFTPVAGINTLTLICTDACGAADTSVTHVTVSTGILLTVVGGAPPEFTEETTDSFFVQITGGDPGSLGFTSGFTAHLGHPDRYSSTLTDSLMKTVITFDYLDEFSSAQSPFAYRIIASDDYSADTLNLSLIVHDNNRTPTINSINDTTFTVGSTLAFDVNATDLDLDNTLTLSKVSGPGTFNSTPGLPPISGDFIWTPTISDIGPHQVIFTVDDGRGGIANDTVNINVVPSGIDLTVIGGAPPVFTEEIADSFFVSLGGYDPSGITFGASFTGHAGTPARYSAVQVDSLIKIVVTFDYLGEFSSANSPFAYRIIALDNYSADTLLLSLIVNDNNRNPEITVGSGYTVMVDHALTFSVTGADLDTDNSLTLSKVSGPGTFPGASGPSPITADFTWTPTIDDLSGSPYTVIFALGDGRGGVDTAAVTITVIPDGSPVIEIIHTPSVFHEGQLDSVVFRAHDPDGDPMGGFGFKFMPPAPDSTFPGVSFRTHGDSAFIRIVFDYLGPWSSSGSPFPMRLLAYSMRTTATVDSTFLNISLEVINTNRKPELTVTGPHSIPAGSNVALDLLATDLDLDDVLTLSAANLPTGSSFVDHGGGAGNFDWSTVSGDTGSYQFRFFVNDDRNETNSRDTVLWDLTVTVPPPCEGLDSALLSIDDCATAVAPGSNVTVGINLLNACPVGGFEILIGTDPTALTLNSVSPTWRIDPDSDGYAEEYFNWVHDPIGPGTARFVWIYDTPEHGVGVPCDSGNGPILLLNYHVASGLPFGALIPVNFTYENDEDYSSNTLSDVTGNLFIHPLLDSGCVRIVDPAEYRGDPNMNCYEYEIADAVLVAQRLIYGFGVWAQDDDMPNTPPCDRHYPGNDNMQEAAGDLNDNGHPDIADLVRFINIINGFIYPKVDAAAGQASFYMDDGIVHVNSDVEIGGALVRIAHSGEIGTLVTSNGMDILYHDAEGVLTVLIYSTSSKRIPAGSQTLFTLDGAGAITDVSASDVYGELMQSRIGPPLPDAFRVEQNYPNPFNAKTLIKFDLPKESDVAINIYSITGRLVETLKSHFNAGEQSVTWDASNMASGIYFAKVTSEQNSRTVKMTLLK